MAGCQRMPQRDKRVSARQAVRRRAVSFMNKQETRLRSEIIEPSECRQSENPGRNDVCRSKRPLDALRMGSVAAIDEQQPYAQVIQRINRQRNHLNRNAANSSVRHAHAVSIERPYLGISLPGSNTLVVKRIREMKKTAVKRIVPP